jgi:hypothetical protein
VVDVSKEEGDEGVETEEKEEVEESEFVIACFDEDEEEEEEVVVEDEPVEREDDEVAEEGEGEAKRYDRKTLVNKWNPVRMPNEKNLYHDLGRNRFSVFWEFVKVRHRRRRPLYVVFADSSTQNKVSTTKLYSHKT